MRSPKFARFKMWYDLGFWTKRMLHNVVGKKNSITAEEYEIIAGEKY